MKVCTNAYTTTKKDNYFPVMTDRVEIHILFLTDSIPYIKAGFDGDFAEESYSLVMTAWEDRMDDFLKGRRTRVEVADIVLPDGDRGTVIKGRSLRAVVEKDSFRIYVHDREGTLLHADIADLAYMEDSDHRQTRASETPPGNCFHGFGEKNGDSNKAQKFMDISSKDAMEYNPGETDSFYRHIPFYIKLNRGTKKAVGYFYHNTYEYDFDMGREKSNCQKPHSRYRTDDGDTNLFLIVGPVVRQIVERYTDLIGKSTMLPQYALGCLGPSMYYPELDESCDDTILDFINTIKEEEISVGDFQLSSGYHTMEADRGVKRYVLTWNKKRFKDPREFFAQMDKRGVSVSLNVRSGILLIHPKLDEMRARGMFVRVSDSDEPGIGTWRGGEDVFTDFARPSARTYWKEVLRENVLEYDTSSVWNDNCEYDSLMDKDCHCGFEGKDGTIGQLKSTMSSIMYHIMDEAIRETFPNTRPYIMCHSGHRDIQRYAQTWAGDNLTCQDSLRYNIATILGMSLSSMTNQSCDISGLYNPSPEAELIVHWIQNGIFQPRFSIHSTNADNTATESWMYGHCTGYIWEVIGLRYQLSPYLYSLMEWAHETGLPIMGLMCSALQEDVKCYEEDVNFMFGDPLLVTNVAEKGASTRKAYLPEGRAFYDSQTRTAYEGGRTVELPVDLRSIPPFVRSGAIIPMTKDRLDNLKTQQAQYIRILCAANRDGRFALYGDDGTSMDYERGDYLKTSITMTVGERTVLDLRQEDHCGTAIKTLYLDMIHREKAPYWVKTDGQIIPRSLHRREFEKADYG